MNKSLYIISGCNGAGKTTASYTVLPEVLDCKEFVNADEIARLQRIEDLLAKDETFSIETTLATKSYINLVRRAQAKGYRVNILFFWLRTPELAMQRVAERVANGGHNIPEDIIRRRYTAGITNLFKLFIPIVDYWAIYDNTERHRKKVATGYLGKKDIFDTELFNTIQGYVR